MIINKVHIYREKQGNRTIIKQNIIKIQDKNCKNFNRKPKKAMLYRIGDLVVSKKTQFGDGMKLQLNFFGLYKDDRPGKPVFTLESECYLWGKSLILTK